MTLEGPDGRRYLVRKDGSLVMKGDGHGRPVTMGGWTRRAQQIVKALLAAKQRTGEARAADKPEVSAPARVRTRHVTRQTETDARGALGDGWFWDPAEHAARRDAGTVRPDGPSTEVNGRVRAVDPPRLPRHPDRHQLR